MFFQLLYIHLFRPFLKYSQATSPLPPNVSPRRLCTQAAIAISKLLRLYKRSHGLRQICNIAVYIANSACTIHLVNLPEKNAKRDITYGVKHLEEIAESWLCARRTLAILSVLSRQWKVELPEEAAAVLARTDAKFSAWSHDIKNRDPARALNTSSPQTPTTRQIIQPSPTLFSTINMVGGGEMHAGQPVQPSDSLPSHGAAELQRDQLSNTGNHLSPAMSRPSVESTGSPSALFGGVEQLLRDSQDWWVKDQNQLAMGFGQWPREGDVAWMGNGGAMDRNMVTQAQIPMQFNGNETVGEDVELAGLLAGISRNGTMGAMGYPNEGEWYQ
jgi:hypothetical protein